MDCARESKPTESSSSEDIESEEETADGSSGISSSVVSSGAMSSDVQQQINTDAAVVRNTDPYQIVEQDIVLDEEDDKDTDDGSVDLSKYCLAGTGIEFSFMRLPDEGVYFGAQVTQVDKPDLVRYKLLLYTYEECVAQWCIQLRTYDSKIVSLTQVYEWVLAYKM